MAETFRVVDSVTKLDASARGAVVVCGSHGALYPAWLAARAGGYHFRHEEGRWVDRDGNEFFDVLSRRASEHAGKDIAFLP